MKYVSLHHHSTFSYMDGYGKPADHVERAADLGMGTMALTEHGNTSSHVQLEKAATKAGVKPIFGLEAYTGPANMRETGNTRKWHLGILAADQTGYVNLNELVSQSWERDFYRWPTVLGGNLAAHADGLIVLSGCADSFINCRMLGGKGQEKPDPDPFRRGVKIAKSFKALLGDRYYLEVQQFPDLARTREINPLMERISKATGIPLVATSDVHYPLPADNEMQKILHSAGRNTGTVVKAEQEWEYDIRLTLPTSDKQVLENLRRTGLSRGAALRALASTAEIASRCNVVLPRSEQIRFPLPEGVPDAKTLIWEELRKGWRYRWERNASLRARRKEYWQRIVYEMELITEKDFNDYFLMISGAVIFAKENGIPVGPARGSAAASLVCYMLRITEVDPLQFPTMMFERFIDPGREDLPDVDLDFADDRRDEVRQYLARQYGADHVGNIGNFTRYRGKNSLDDVGRVHQIPAWKVKIVKDLVLERSGGDSRFDASLEDTIAMFPQAKAVFDEYPALKFALDLEGNYKGMGVHAAGIVVSNAPINDTCAYYTRKNVGANKTTLSVLAYDKKDAEYLGMLKVDALGLSTMGLISLALKDIGMTLDELYQIPLDDPETMAAFKRADVVGIFQFEGRATRLMTRDVSPDTFMEIADINALSRPGPLFSGASATYVDIKHGRKEVEHLHPIVDKYTQATYSQIVYQEQVLAIIKEMGGFPVKKIGDIRKIISQKLGEASFNTMMEEFLAGAKKLHGIEADLATRIWKQMVTSATYSFNVAHCISYGMLAFWCMWLKVHHPAAFYAAALTKCDDKKYPRLIRDAERHGVTITAPDIRISGPTWTADIPNNAVRAGFQQVPGIGKVTALSIEEWREHFEREAWPDLTWEDMLTIKGIGPKTIEKIRAWAENDDPFGLRYIEDTLNELRSLIASRAIPVNPRPNVRSNDLIDMAGDEVVVWMGFAETREYKDYIEDERARSGDSVEDIKARMDRPDLVKSCALKCYDDGDEDVYLRFSRKRFPDFERKLERLALDETEVLVAKGLRWGQGIGAVIYVKNIQIISVAEEVDEEVEEEAEDLYAETA